MLALYESAPQSTLSLHFPSFDVDGTKVQVHVCGFSNKHIQHTGSLARLFSNENSMGAFSEKLECDIISVS